MDTQAILAGLAVGLSIANTGFIIRLLWLRGDDKASGALKSTTAPTPAQATPAAETGQVPTSKYRVCAQCKHTVARYTPQGDGSVVCANCHPLE